MHRIYIVFGVSGSGKSTVGQLLASKLGIPFFDADRFHSSANVEKMSQGIALDDDDRSDWLDRLNQLILTEGKKRSLVLACSALKEKYRTHLSRHVTLPISWVLMDGNFELIENRLNERTDHFMRAGLLKSQFETLEIPAYGLKVDVRNSPQQMVDSILNHVESMQKTVGVVGMGVMGRNLARNIGRNGFRLSLYNRRVEGKEEYVAGKAIEAFQELCHATGFENLSDFVSSLSGPRIIICMIPAGEMDNFISEIKTLLQAGDVLIDGGNSHYKDTERRQASLQQTGVNFIGAGISGGEEGALHGPSIMVGGQEHAYRVVGLFLEKIAAKQNENPCCARVGGGGAGHFVKMVHNGIEYAEMQLLAEVYSILRGPLDYDPDQIANILIEWSGTACESYLLSVTIDVLRKKEGDGWLIDKILDKAENKGTGSWTTIAAAELGIPIPTITESLFARYASFFKSLRSKYALDLAVTEEPSSFSPEQLRNAYQLARVSNHQQGFHLIDAASKRFDWNISLGTLAGIWTNGCIIRSTLMESLQHSLKKYELPLHDPEIHNQIKLWHADAVSVAGHAMAMGIAIPALSSAIAYIQMMGTPSSNANLIQAQRDYFGAHTYERVDNPGKKIHTNWK